jgi:hypothetical protein
MKDKKDALLPFYRPHLGTTRACLVVVVVVVW